MAKAAAIAEIEVTRAMLDAGVRELLFWLDGAALESSPIAREQAVAGVFYTMIGVAPTRGLGSRQTGNCQAR